MEKNNKNNYNLVFDKYKTEYLNRNIAEIAQNTHSSITEDGKYLCLTYWSKQYLIDNQTGELYLKEDPMYLVDISDKLVIMSYLLDCKKNAVRSNNYVSFREIKKAAPFENAFYKLAFEPLLSTFDGNIELFKRAAQSLGGQECPYKDYSVKFEVFYHIDLIYIFWEGDDEFPSRVNILFDQNITDFIHEECVPVVGIDGALKLCDFVKK